ncbi:hypothetical protein [Phyllobacterium ifriqiyense]|nr:hypothetical protein [Phyllobacterium ifriqiyense]
MKGSAAAAGFAQNAAVKSARAKPKDFILLTAANILNSNRLPIINKTLMSEWTMSQSQWRHDPAIVNIWLKFELSHFRNSDDVIFGAFCHILLKESHPDNALERRCLAP